MRLFAARGETEPAGILIGTSVPLADIRVAAQVPGIAVAVKDPDGPPLLPTFHLGASECVELVLSFTVPADAAPGIRTGEVRVTASGAGVTLRIESRSCRSRCP